MVIGCSVSGQSWGKFRVYSMRYCLFCLHTAKKPMQRIFLLLFVHFVTVVNRTRRHNKTAAYPFNEER